jgi:orotate phosphoribosyltransferase
MDKMNEAATEVARILLEERAVTINTVNPYTFVSGTISPIYCDLRLLIGSPVSRGRIVELLIETIKGTVPDTEMDVMAGVATAGITWAAWVATVLEKPMVYVRDAPKGHGAQRQIEGGVLIEQTALVFEDLTSTGDSAIAAAKTLRENSAKVDYCFSIFTYEFPMATQAFSKEGITLVTLCGISTFLDVASQKEYISKEDEQAVKRWLDETQARANAK